MVRLPLSPLPSYTAASPAQVRNLFSGLIPTNPCFGYRRCVPVMGLRWRRPFASPEAHSAPLSAALRTFQDPDSIQRQMRRQMSGGTRRERRRRPGRLVDDHLHRPRGRRL
ncbi:hypothetical protein GUJ93_ZPchr0013g37644 [Zizania palustris]|uniref:Uncharacterized protein n=1 Tax=Zizania palustris TaxID=103762 RepID=A0A8J6BUW9_ZIZPA|nr:hypothetical protein GUJ93_ZPchr0013g37644 [Zizania palustris]